MRGTGRIVSWNDEKGFGFISPLAGGNQVFVHIKAFSNRSRRPEVDQIVTYSIAKDAQGRPCAARVTFAGDRDERKVLRDSITAPIVIALVFLAAVGLSAMMGYLPGPVGLAYAALSPITFFAYAFDKSAAKKDARRTPESTLHLLGLAGGWPGALIAQQTLRHKSRKASFRAIFRITVLINCSGFVWLHTENARNLLATILA